MRKGRHRTSENSQQFVYEMGIREEFLRVLYIRVALNISIFEMIEVIFFSEPVGICLVLLGAPRNLAVIFGKISVARARRC